MSEERIPLAPFLEWCEGRLRQLAAELDAFPALAEASRADPVNRLLMDIGWDDPVAERRLYRWRTDNTKGRVPRHLVEDALHRAGVLFSDIYPDAPPRPVHVRLGEQRKMTDAEVLAAHTVYVKARMTTDSLAEQIYERFGYRSIDSCARALCVAFRGLGLPLRQCASITAKGVRCERNPLAGDDHCAEHWAGVRPSSIGGPRSGAIRTAQAYHLPPELLARARHMHVNQGVSMRDIGLELLPLTPWSSAKHLARCVADIADAEGWHRTAHVGRRRTHRLTERKSIARAA